MRALSYLVTYCVFVLEQRMEFISRIRVLIRVNLRERHFFVGKDGTRLPIPIFLQFLLQLQGSLVNDWHRGKRSTYAGESLLTLRDFRGHIHLHN